MKIRSNISKLLFIFILICPLYIFLILGIGPVFSQTDTCVSAKCHPNMGKAAFVHQPVKEVMCITCHQATEEPGKKTRHPGNLTISLIQQGADLCYMCHGPKDKKRRSMHLLWPETASHATIPTSLRTKAYLRKPCQSSVLGAILKACLSRMLCIYR